jgi:hypothetical protein
MWGEGRLHIRNCAGSYNNLVPRVDKLSAIDVTLKIFFERLYLFQDWTGLILVELRVNCPYAPTPPLFTLQLFLDFCAIFFGCGPLFFVSTRFTK